MNKRLGKFLGSETYVSDRLYPDACRYIPIRRRLFEYALSHIWDEVRNRLYDKLYLIYQQEEHHE